MLTLAVTYSGLLGGAERTLVDFAGGLPGGVAIACPDGPLAEHARDSGLVVFPLRERPLELRGGPARGLRAGAHLSGHARELRRLAYALRPELLLAWGMRSAIAAAAALTGLEPRPPLLVRHIDFLPGPLIGRLVRAAARRAQGVSVNSRAVAHDLDPDSRLQDRLSVVSPGVELSAYSAEWDVGPDPEVLMLGALEPWKRPDLALEAVALAARELPQIRLTVAGASLAAPGERLAVRLRERAERPDLAGRVELTGALSDVRPALRRAWCLLHCAEREPFGTVVLQALASGRPVVAPDAGSPAEVVDESCGRLYPPGDARAAAAALVELLSSPELARSLGAAGRARAEGFDAGAARDRFAAAALQALPGGDARRSDAGAGAALITVTHNSSAELPRLLLSARRHLPRAKLIVVDSGSEDGSADAARAAAPDAAVIELSENVGFGRASNAGVAVAGELVSVLVNPDVELVDDSLAALAAELLEAGAPERMLAPLALSRDGARQDTAQLDPRSPLLWLRALAPPVALPGPLRRAIDPWRAQRRRRVGWAVGCCLIARTETLRRLGPFDERIFLFGEDLDLGMRAAEQGIETWFCPDARVLHLDSHAVDRAFGGEPFEALARQRRAVIGERWGPRAAWRDHWTMLLTYANRIAIKTLLARPSARERKQLAAEWRARRAPARL